MEDLYSWKKSKKTPSMPPKKSFKAQCALTVVKDYRKKEEDSYWLELGGSKKYKIIDQTWEELQTNYLYKEVLLHVVRDIRDEEDIGVTK